MASISVSTTTISASEYGGTLMMDDLPKFSPGASAILIGAQEEALKRERPFVGSEHFLLSLLLNPSSRIYDHIRLNLYDSDRPSSTAWKDRIVSLLDSRLCGSPLNSVAASKGINYPPFSSSMLEVFQIVKQISSAPIRDGDQIISDGLVTSEFLVAGIMLHGVNIASEVLSRASKGLINSWTILDAINVNPKELHVNRNGVRKSSTFSKQEGPFLGPAGLFTVGSETLPELSALKPAPTHNSNWLIPGRLVIGSKPDESEAAILSAAGVTTFVSLIGEHSFKDYQTGSSKVRYPRGVERGNFVHFPIADFEIPPQDDLVAFVFELKQRIISGECLFVHCRGGHGRTGTVVIPLMASLFDVSDMVATDFVNESTLTTRQSDVAYANQGWEAEMPETNEQRQMTSSVNDAVRLKVPRRR